MNNNAILRNLVILIRKIYYPFGRTRGVIHELVLDKKIYNNMLAYYKDSNDAEIQEIMNFLKNNKVHTYPYEYIYKYSPGHVYIHRDSIFANRYAVVDNYKVYFPREYGSREIRKAVTYALIEQDDLSPHKYLSDNFNISYGDTAVLMGASDGIFCMSIIEKAKKVFLFEPDPKWIKPLRLTFEPWRDKVEIIQKSVSDIDDKDSVRLDSFFGAKKENVDFIQMDTEGCEKKVLAGASDLLERERNLKLSIACYHNPNDYEEISSVLRGKGYTVNSTKGYVIWRGFLPAKVPHLRKGVIHAYKH